MTFTLRRQSLAALMLAAIASLPFLSRFHYLPLPQWWGEITVVFLAALACWCMPRQAAAELPRSALWMLLLAAVWALQPLLQPLLFPGLNHATALAFVALAVLAWATAQWRAAEGSDAVIALLCKSLLLGALAQSLIGLAQLTGLAQLLGGVLFYDSSHPTTNIFGHIGQRNQYAHYLTWGVVAACWLAASGQWSRRWLAAAVLWLSLSIAFAGSRTVLLYTVALAVLAPWWHWRVRSGESRRMWWLLWLAVVAIIAMQFALPLAERLLAPLMHGQTIASGVERLSSNADSMGARRVAEWGKAWLVFKAHPGFGVGWNQYAAESVRLQMLPQFSNSGVNSGLFTNAHNLVFQLLAEMGLLGTLAVLLGFAWAVWPYFSRRVDAAQLVPVAVMSVTLIHSMLEYPLWYLYFPAVVVIMATLVPAPGRAAPLPWLLLARAGALLLLVLASYGSWRYEEMQGLYYPTALKKQQRLEEIIRTEPMFAAHALGLLDDVMTPSRATLKDYRKWVDLMALYRPYPDVLLRKAQMEALAGEQAKAAQTMRYALASFPTYASQFLDELDDDEPAWSGLIDIAQQVDDKQHGKAASE
ncbi:PglL family O-oligosaccharyltransferase [Vogesella sp. LIG4]|uniref:PglL family O-oligosaccharyltransferase n=1 Tax=Vogesella sp. LIG4 TaxID=1192162 RepID=UPI00081F8D9D|nr:O-antigen ligase family protein [Vogesella sp. LIG4]SCK10404.1 O-antigen ligase [Vogesella sp. LIG4]